MANLDAEIEKLAAEYQSYRVAGGKKIVAPQELKRRVVILAERAKGKVTLVDLARRLRISPASIRVWGSGVRQVIDHEPKFIPVRIAPKSKPAIPSSGDVIILSFREVKVTLPMATDPQFVAGLIEALIERAAC